MVRKRGNKRRRQRFVTLHALHDGDKDIKALVKEARLLGSSQSQREKRSQEAENATSRAMQDAEAVRELFMIGVPQNTTASTLVRRLLQNLFLRHLIDVHELNKVHNSLGKSEGSVVLRCEIRPNKRGGNTNTAFVTMRNAQLAQELLELSPLSLQPGVIVTVLPSKRLSVPGVGTAWRMSRDPGSIRWRIGRFQVGERVSEGVFSSFWTSSPFFDLTENSHVELNPVANVLAVTIGRPQVVLKAQPGRNNSAAENGHFVPTYSMLRVEFPFRSICDSAKAEKSHRKTNGYAVYFPISKAPHIFRAADDLLKTKVIDELTWDHLGGAGRETRWIRTIDPTPHSAFSRARGIRILLGAEEMYSLFRKLYHHCLADTPRPALTTAKSQSETNAPHRHAMLQLAAEQYGVSFRVRYMVDCILSLGTVGESSIGSQFWEVLSKELTEDEAVTVLDFMLFRLGSNHAFTQVNDPLDELRRCATMLNILPKTVNQQSIESTEAQSDSGDSVGTAGTEDFLMEKYVRELRLEELSISGDGDTSEISFEGKQSSGTSRASRPSRQHAYIRRLICTPTRTIAQRAEFDLLNRVLREYSQHKDRFLRVSFSDEDGGSIGFQGSQDLYARIRAALRDGIRAGGEKFVFLAFSNSQLRDHAVWMYNETPSADSLPLSADEIRTWMGNFSHIRAPGKYAARQGQAFSSTVGTLVLERFQEQHISDLYDPTRAYMFSDGVGIMSRELAREVAKRLRLDPRRGVPSAFQIRYGGAKGVLSAWNIQISSRRDVEIMLRPSMTKFQSEHRALEIVGFSKRLPLFLNRQIITLLSGLGVPDKPFEEMQDKLLRQLDRAMQNDGAADALDLLFSSGCFDSDLKLKFSGPMMNPGAFFRAGLTCVSCEHLFNIMYAFRKRIIKELMLRTRIPIESSKGFCALGVMDEAGVLELREVGSRPLPSMLSGGDLDGDIYFCLFDEKIAYPEIPPAPAMNYAAPVPKELHRPVCTSDVEDFFVDFIRNDNLGQIANAHVVHADREKMGIRSEKCLKLAQLHSTAVDFAKTGVPARFPRELQTKNMEQQYPDFMGRHAKVSYKSGRILGKLYRACNASRTGNDRDFPHFPNPRSVRVDDIIDKFPHYEDLDYEAEQLCQAYNVEIARLIDQYGVQHEAEVVSGQVLSFSARHAQIRGRREYFALLMRLNRQASELRLRFRDEFFAGLGQRAGGKYNTDTIAKACAWHRACRRVATADRIAGRTVLVSFPWVMSDVLLQVIGNERTTAARPAFRFEDQQRG